MVLIGARRGMLTNVIMMNNSNIKHLAISLNGVIMNNAGIDFQVRMDGYKSRCRSIMETHIVASSRSATNNLL